MLTNSLLRFLLALTLSIVLSFGVAQPTIAAITPIKLTLPVTTGSAIELEISFTTIQEWQAVSAYSLT